MTARSSPLLRLGALALFLSWPVRGDDRAFKLEPVPDSLPESQRSTFLERRATLLKAAEKLNDRADTFMARCASVSATDTGRIASCREEQRQIEADQDRAIGQAAAFRTQVRSASLRQAIDGLARELKSIEATSVHGRQMADQVIPYDARSRNLNTAMEKAKAEAAKGFDTGRGPDRGSLKLDGTSVDGRSVQGDPAVPQGKRTPQIDELEQRRTAIRKARQEVEEKLTRLQEANAKSSDPAAQMAIVDAKQKITDGEHAEGFVNFRIRKLLAETSGAVDPLRRREYFHPNGASVTAATAALCAKCAREGGEHCNWFVANVATQLGIPYLRDLKPHEGRGLHAARHVADREGRLANQVWDKMDEMARSPASGWVLAKSRSEAQALADRGLFVFGVAKNVTGNPCPASGGGVSGCGHLAVVAPTSSVHRARCAYGPCRHDLPYVFDQVNNIEGSTGFNNTFRRTGHTEPRWYVYLAEVDER